MLPQQARETSRKHVAQPFTQPAAPERTARLDLFGHVLHVRRFEIGAEANDITVFVVSNSLFVGKVEDVEEVFGDVVILLEEENQT